MNNMIILLEKQIKEFQKDINLQNNNKNYNELRKILNNKEEEIKKYINEINILNEEKTKLYEDNSKMFNDIAYLQKKLIQFSKNKKIISEEKFNGSYNESNYSLLNNDLNNINKIKDEKSNLNNNEYINTYSNEENSFNNFNDF